MTSKINQQYKLKRHPSGLINKFKARLCARGDLQQHGLNYWETYSPVVQWSTVRLCLILAHKYNLLTHQCDYSNAYCQSPLDEDLYMEIPARFCCDVRTQKLFRSKHAHEHKNKYVLKLNMSLYGLRLAGLNWFSFLTKFLLENGFIQSYVEPCLFYSTSTTPFSSLKTNLRSMTSFQPSSKPSISQKTPTSTPSSE